MTLGKECELIGSPPPPVADIEVIAGLTPKDNESEVDVFVNPQAIFNLEIGKQFSLTDLEGKRRAYRVKLDFARIKTEEGEVVNATHEWNEPHDVLAVNSFEVLPPETKLVFEVQVSFEEQVGGNWVVVTYEGQKVTEYRTVSFKTGKAPDYIPKNNVLYAYPVDRQLNYYIDETKEGYIKLNKGQAYLFQDPAWEYRGKLSPADGSASIYFDIGYDVENREVFFEMPDGLHTTTVYTLQLVRIPLVVSQEVDKNVVTKYKVDEEAGVKTRERSAEGSLKVMEEDEFFTMHFRTSRFRTFVEKMDNLQRSGDDWLWPVAVGIHEIGRTWIDNESFDRFEMQGGAHFEPLIYAEASPNADWLLYHIRPLLYDGYLEQSVLRITNRDIDELGLVPVRAIQWTMPDFTDELRDEHITSGAYTPISGVFSLVYDLARVAHNDRTELRNKAAAAEHRGISNSYIHNLLLKDWVPIQPGTYPLKLRYRLPGTGRTTSEWVTEINID